MTSLKPCPFCGSTAQIVTLDPWYENPPIGIGCSKCPVILAEYCDYKKFGTEAEAIEAWNARTSDAPDECEMEKSLFTSAWKCSACGTVNGGIFGESNFEAPKVCPSCGKVVK